MTAAAAKALNRDLRTTVTTVVPEMIALSRRFLWRFLLTAVVYIDAFALPCGIIAYVEHVCLAYDVWIWTHIMTKLEKYILIIVFLKASYHGIWKLGTAISIEKFNRESWKLKNKSVMINDHCMYDIVCNVRK